MSHEIKQIIAPLRFVCLRLLISVLHLKQKLLHTQKKNYTIINQSRQNHVPLNARSWNDLKRSLDGSLILEDMLTQTTRMGFYTIQHTQNYGGAIQSCIVYQGTINLKDKYAPNKNSKTSNKNCHFCGVWDSSTIFSKQRTMPNTKLSFLQIFQMKFRIHYLRNKLGKLTHVFNHHQNVIVEFLDFLITFSP